MNLLLADVGATVVVFIFSCILKNSSVYDPYWSVQPIINLLGIHLVPTLVVYFCTFPAAEIILSEYKLNIMTILSLILSTVAFLIQGIADIQMHRFKKRNGQGFIRDGLWKYSRHPNYFGEILMWWGIGIASLSCMPSNIYYLLGAFLNTMLFLFISIPMADKRNQKRGYFYQFKKETRMLLPIKK